MTAYKQKLLDGLFASDRRQYKIPIYQRKYKWTQHECFRLIDDLLRASQKNKEHFTGTIVLKTPTRNSSIETVFLVDGQQRMTTIMLIVKALELITEHKQIDSDFHYVYKNTKKYLFADQNDSDKGFKLVLSKNDRETFNLILQGKSLSDIENNPQILKHKDNHLYNNFKSLFERILEELKEGKNVKSEIFDGLLKLNVVCLELEHLDDAQEIFESINSLGIPLSQADLIRNFLLMSSHNQDKLYENYWEPIQDKLIQDESSMDDFVKNYLLTKRNYNIKDNLVYREYVDYASTQGDIETNRESLLNELKEAAEIYQPFLRKTSSYSDETNSLMQELRDMRQSTTYPFLIRVFLDRKANIVDDNTLNKVINLIIVYLVRRTICGVPTNSLRNFMISLYNRVFEKVFSNKKHYYEAIYQFLKTVNSRDALLENDEVARFIPTYPLYSNTAFATYVLYRIENGRFPKPASEFVTAKSVTVEHILPQNLSNEWIEDLGTDAQVIHEKYVNTLGNLSLSSSQKNSAMSDEAFEYKKEFLLSETSKFDLLNRSLKTLETFGENEILNRAQELGKILLSRYELQEPSIVGIQFEDVEEIICDGENTSIFKHAKPLSFRLRGEEYAVNSFAVLLIKFLKKMLKLYPEKIRELAANGYTPWNGDKKFLIYSNQEKHEEIGEGIKLVNGISAPDIIYFATSVLKECALEPQELIVIIKKDSLKNNIFNYIKEALTELSNEGLIIYDYNKMPKSETAIKFKVDLLDKIFNTTNYDTLWDKERFSEIAFCEIFTKSETITITIKTISKSQVIKDKLIFLKDKHSLKEPTMRDYWKIKSFPVRIRDVLDSEPKLANLKKELKSVIMEIKSFLEQVSSDF
jgi:uncharacterized protein with ParB-like and HNH nuclease domain